MSLKVGAKGVVAENRAVENAIVGGSSLVMASCFFFLTVF